MLACLLAWLGVGCVAYAADASDLLSMLKLSDVATVTRGVPVQMRDGVQLMATVILPTAAADHVRRPAILIQSPYAVGNELGGAVSLQLIPRLVREGYAVVVVNDRGTQWSEGEYHWEKGARNDGLDALNWLTSQPWSDGKVGALGCSSSAEVEFALATANPPALKTWVEMGGATGAGVIPGYADQGIFYTGGIPSFDWAWWYHGNGYLHHPKLPRGISQTEREALISAFASNPRYTGDDLSWAGHLPSAEILDAIGSPETEFDRLIRMKPNDPRWSEYDFLRTGDSTRIPGLHVDSWYDTIEVYGTARIFEYLSANSPNQYMVVGPTAHCREGTETEQTMVGHRPVGDGRFDYVGMLVKWFDHWVKDDGKGPFDMPRVQYYALESNRWSSAPKWPVSSTPLKLYLTSGGHAATLSGDGALKRDPPGGGASSDELVSDPMNPTPTLGGGCCTPDVSLDQSEIEKRPDVLVFTSDPLTSPLDVAGYISATLFFSTSVKDTDLMLKLVDVYPDGRAFNILDTGQRLRYRDGIGREKLMTPGQVYRLTLGQMALASHFAPGHRLRIEISGTNFPEYERNMNTGGSNFDESHPIIAHDRVWHDRARASFIELPVVHPAS